MNPRKIVMLGLLVAAVAVAAPIALSQDRPSAATGGLFAGLKAGQSIQVKNLGTAFQISTYPRSISGNLRIVEIAAGYIEIEDTKRTRTRIPVHSVKCVVFVKQ